MYFHFHTSQFILTPFQLLSAYSNPNMASGCLTGRCNPKLLTSWRQEPHLLFPVIISSEPITVSRMYSVTGIPRIYAEYWINESNPTSTLSKKNLRSSHRSIWSSPATWICCKKAMFLLLFYISILLIFESLTLKFQLKILTYLLKKIILIYSGTICNFVLYFPSFL